MSECGHYRLPVDMTEARMVIAGLRARLAEAEERERQLVKLRQQEATEFLKVEKRAEAAEAVVRAVKVAQSECEHTGNYSFTEIDKAVHAYDKARQE